MSALPPYNPPPTERRLWLVNDETPGDDLTRLLDSAGAGGVERVATDDPGELGLLLEASARDLLLVAPEETLQLVVLSLIGGQPGMARLRFLAGAISQVQVLSGRAVVRHLNRGVEL